MVSIWFSVIPLSFPGGLTDPAGALKISLNSFYFSQQLVAS